MHADETRDKAEMQVDETRDKAEVHADERLSHWDLRWLPTVLLG